MSEEVETLGEAPPPLNNLLPRTVKSFMQFSYSVTPPPPRVSGSALFKVCLNWNSRNRIQRQTSQPYSAQNSETGVNLE